MPPALPPTRIDLAGQPIWYQAITAGSAGDEVVLELYAESEHYLGDYQLVATVARRCDEEGIALFRVDAMLISLLKPFVPTTSTTTVRVRTSILNYYVRFGIRPATDAAPATWTESELMTAMLGAVGPTFGNYFDWLSAQPEAGRPFLTWLPEYYTIGKTQPGWLFFLCPGTINDVIHIRRRYSQSSASGETQWETVNLSLLPSRQYVLLAVPIRANGWTNANQLVITITDAGGNARSEMFSFRIVDDTGSRARYFLFDNSLGCLDVLRTSGRYENTLEAKPDVATRPALNPANDEREAVYSQQVTDRDKIFTGFLSRVERQWLRELIFSKTAWEWREGQFVPVVIVKKSLSIPSSESQALVGASFEIETATPPRGHAQLVRAIRVDDGEYFEDPVAE